MPTHLSLVSYQTLTYEHHTTFLMETLFGSIRLRDNISFRIVQNVDEAKQLWHRFSPHVALDDSWDFRYLFYKYLEIPLYFSAIYHGDAPVGLLPLQFNTGKGAIPESYVTSPPFYEFFGGDDMDSNEIFIHRGYENLLPELFERIPSNTILAPLAHPLKYKDSESREYTNKFVADISDISSFEDFMVTFFEGSSRGKMMNKLNRVAKTSGIQVVEGNKSDLALLFQLNIERFGNSSSFAHHYRRQIFNDLFEMYPTDIFTVVVGGEKKAVSFSINSDGVYSSMNIGYDYEIRDLGKFVVATQIKRAIKLGCKVYDAGKGDSGWKEQFHLTRIPQYMLTINR